VASTRTDPILSSLMQKPDITATSTERPTNRFTALLYLRVSPEGTLFPIERRKRRAAHYTISLLIEYPTYQDELKIKQDATRYDEGHHVHYIDFDTLTESRVRKCLVSWDLHEKIPGFTQRLHRVTGLLEDDSMESWQKLPPLVRKAISILISEALGHA